MSATLQPMPHELSTRLDDSFDERYNLWLHIGVYEPPDGSHDGGFNRQFENSHKNLQGTTAPLRYLNMQTRKSGFTNRHSNVDT